MIIILPIILLCKVMITTSFFGLTGPTGPTGPIALTGPLGPTIQDNLPIFPYSANIYKKKINFPLIGGQTVETEIITNNYALIKLEGIINKNGYVKYITNKNRYLFKLSYNLRKIIRKYNIEIISLSYNIENDSIDFDVNIKYIRYKSFIQLERLNY